MKTTTHTPAILEWHRESSANRPLAELPVRRPQKTQLEPPEPEITVSDGEVWFFTILLGVFCVVAMYLFWAKLNSWWPF